MALKVKAVEKKIKFDKNPDNPGVWRYVMSPELYAALTQAKVIKEAALRSGVSRGWRGHQGVGNRGSLGGTAWTGYHVFRTARQER